MKKACKYILTIAIAAFTSSCGHDNPFDYPVEYADGYPNIMAGVWKAYDFAPGEYEFPLNSSAYELIIAVDPADTNRLILDNIYNSNLRTRTFVNKARSLYYVTKGEQLEKNNALFEIETISILGQYIEEDDFFVLYVGLYDKYDDLFDTIHIAGFRKTGFEDVREYDFDFLFD